MHFYSMSIQLNSLPGSVGTIEVCSAEALEVLCLHFHIYEAADAAKKTDLSSEITDNAQWIRDNFEDGEIKDYISGLAK